MNTISNTTARVLADVLIESNTKNINVSTNARINSVYKKFIDTVDNLKNPFYKKAMTKMLADNNINNGNDLYRIISDDEVISMFSNDNNGKTIKFTFTKETENHRNLKADFYQSITFDENDIKNPDLTWVIRNADGKSTPMFVFGGDEYISKYEHQLSQLYHYETHTPYYDARPIKYSTWLANPNKQISTR